MKNTLLSLCLGLSLSFAFGQTVIEKVLSNEIKFTLSDGVRLDDGTWMFSAFAYSITPGDSAMAMVVKTDSSFNPLWAKRYKNLRRDDFSCITLLKEGNVLVGGTMRQNFSNQNGGSVFKLDTAGNVIWQLLYEEDFDDRVLDIFEQADSSLMIFIREGVTNGPTKVIHATKDGSILSQRTYALDSNPSLGLLANSVVVDENEQYYFSGSVANQGAQELYVCAVNDANFLWYRRFRFNDRSIGSFTSTYIPSDQSIILGGSIADTVGIFVNIWLAKIDLQGNVKWMKEYGQDLGYTENAAGIKPLPNGDLLMFGSVFDDQGSQAFVMRLDSLGNKIWEKGYDPASPRFGIGDLFLLPDGRMLLNAGSGEDAYLLTTSADGQNACSSSTVSFNVADLTATEATYPLSSSNPMVQEVIPIVTIAEVVVNDSLLCANSVGIENLAEVALEIYPNPAQDQLIVVLPEGFAKQHSCTLIDALGRKIAPKMNRSSREIEIDLSDLAKGIYWIYLSGDGKVASRSFVRN